MKQTTSKISFMLLMNILLASLVIGALYIQPAKAIVEPNLIRAGEYDESPIREDPYGKLNVIIEIFKLRYDGNSQYDWYWYQATFGDGMQIQSMPGKAAYGSTWEQDYHAEIFYVENNGGTYERWLAGYGPTNTDGYSQSGQTASVGLSLTGPSGTVGWSKSYSIPWIRVEDHSDIDQLVNRAGWVHAFNYDGDNNPNGPSDNGHLSTPAFMVKTLQDHWSWVNCEFYTRYQRLEWWGWQASQQFYTYYGGLDALRIGDN
jgi:hypothetical protein